MGHFGTDGKLHIRDLSLSQSVTDVTILTTLWYVNHCPCNPDHNHKKALNYFLWIMLVILSKLIVMKVRTSINQKPGHRRTGRTKCQWIPDFYQILGELLASSTMGVTLIDLFGEIVSENDLKYFLRPGFSYYISKSISYRLYLIDYNSLSNAT